jgi:hypothetical protein
MIPKGLGVINSRKTAKTRQKHAKNTPKISLSSREASPTSKKNEISLLYKITDAQDRTIHNTQWGPNVTNKATGKKTEHLCSDGWIHAYENLLVGLFLSPLHANYTPFYVWIAKGKISNRDRQLKCGCRKLTTIRQITSIEITVEDGQFVADCLPCNAPQTELHNRMEEVAKRAVDKLMQKKSGVPKT